MFFRFFICVLSVLTLINASASSAQTAEPAKPSALTRLEQQGVLVRYLGNDYGMNGWLTVRNGQIEYMYATPDNSGLVLGILFDNAGESVTAKQLDRLYGANGSAPQSDPTASLMRDSLAIANNMKAEQAPTQADASKPSKGDALLSRLAAANSVTLGQDNAPQAFAVIDMECRHCHDFIQKLDDGGHFANGNIQLHAVPVAVLSKKSLEEAAIILNTDNAAEKLLAHAKGDTTALALPEGAEAPSDAAILPNMQLLKDYKIDVTPFIVYRGKDGGVRIIRGTPRDMNGFIGDIAP